MCHLLKQADTKKCDGQTDTKSMNDRQMDRLWKSDHIRAMCDHANSGNTKMIIKYVTIKENLLYLPRTKSEEHRNFLVWLQYALVWYSCDKGDQLICLPLYLLSLSLICKGCQCVLGQVNSLWEKIIPQSFDSVRQLTEHF